MNHYLKYIEEHIDEMFKEPNGNIKYPYTIPGGSYSTDLWDWDSFYSAKAIIAFIEYENKHKPGYLKEDFINKSKSSIKGNVLNFFELQKEDGFVPIMTTYDHILEDELYRMKENGSVNQHKPFLAQNALQASLFINDFTWLTKYIDNLDKYFSFYKKNQYHEPTGLYLFNNDVMIGIDNDPSVFGRPDRSTASIFLNSFLVEDFNSMIIILDKLKLKDKKEYYINELNNLKLSINKYCFDKYTNMYYSVDVNISTHETKYFHHGLNAFWNVIPLKIRSFLGLIPLYLNITDNMNKKMEIIDMVLSDDGLMSNYGIRTLSKNELMYSLAPSGNPSNWNGPIWGISNYIFIKVLFMNGYSGEAKHYLYKTIQMFENDIINNGSMSEYYNPDNGNPIMNHGFMNWNLLMIELLNYVE